MPPNRFESEVESFLEGSHGDRTHIKRADHPRLHHYAGHYYRSGCVLRGLWMLRVSVDRGGLSVAKVAPFAEFIAMRRPIRIGCDDPDRL